MCIRDSKYTLDFDVTPHQLRHTYITNLLYAGVDPKTEMCIRDSNMDSIVSFTEEHCGVEDSVSYYLYAVPEKSIEALSLSDYKMCIRDSVYPYRRTGRSALPGH